MLSWRDHSTDWTMLTVCLVPANVYSVQLYCAAVLCSCTPCQDSHYRLHFSVPLATIRDPGELLVSATDIILSGHWPGPVCFNAADRRWRRDAGPLGAIIFTLRPPRELFISTCCPCSALTISQGGDMQLRPMGGRGWGALTNQGPGHSASQLLTTNFIAIAEIMLV